MSRFAIDEKRSILLRADRPTFTSALQGVRLTGKSEAVIFQVTSGLNCIAAPSAMMNRSRPLSL
jgi:hypothetical protein